MFIFVSALEPLAAAQAAWSSPVPIEATSRQVVYEAERVILA